MLLDRASAAAAAPVTRPTTERAVWPDRLFLIALAVLCGLAIFIGVAPVAIFGHDIFFFLDNGYRVLQGQVPHRDFESAWGPLMYLMDAAGLKLAGLRPEGLGYANALFGGLIATWAWWLARRRLSPVAACAIGIYTLLLIVAPFSLGYGPLNFSFAMVYNRYGFALLGIVVVECMTLAEDDARGGFAMGIACGLLAFLKVTYAVVAVPLMLITGGAALFRKRWLAAVCAGGALAAILALMYLRFDIASMLSDLSMAAQGRSRSWRPREILLLGIGQVAESIPLMLLALAAGESRLRSGAIAFGTLLLGGFLLSTNHQPASLPLDGFVAIVFADQFFRRPSARTGGLAEAAVVAVLAFACVGPLCFQNAVSMAAAANEKTHPSNPYMSRLDSARGASLTFPPSPFETETGGPAYVRAINDGLALLRRRTGPHDGVLTIDMMNPFNYLLDRPSPTGGLAAGAYNYVISDVAHPSGDRWVGSARYVMVRKYSHEVKDFAVENYHVDGIRRIYQPILDERFRVLDETDHWILYVRR
jgi:hypothetical protein